MKPADAPLQIALLIDDSAAATDATSYLRDGLAAFLERMRGKAEIGLITVGERPTVLAPYTTDTEVAQQAGAAGSSRARAPAPICSTRSSTRAGRSPSVRRRGR